MRGAAREGSSRSESRRRGSPRPSPLAAGERGGGALYVVATPIGTLDDFSPRARTVLAGVDLIVAEDTRRVRQLLNHFSIATPARSLHEHNEARLVPHLLGRLQGGASLALVSDAGTPLLCDPGLRLVRACREAGVAVRCVPGPSAVTAALSVAGVPPYPFTFLGFLPPSPAARQRLLAAHATLPHTLVLFLSPHRLAAELAACAGALGGERDAVLLAELSKLYERAEQASLATLAEQARTRVPRGEYTLVVAPPTPPPPPQVDAKTAAAAVAEGLAAGLSLPEARRAAARRLGISRRELYALVARPPQPSARARRY